jgi:N-acetylmuramoyl-L-alanine amidase
MQTFNGSNLGRTHRHIVWLSFICLLVLPSPAHATSVARKKQLALEQYHKAETLRQALEARSENDRSTEDYDRVIDAFRKVYHIAPTSTRADASVFAVGDLLTEQAAPSDDEKGFKSAIGQYEFLSREYPGSKYRFQALLNIAQIYREDLEDAPSAKATYEDFLKRYPDHHLAQDARTALKEMEQDAEHKPQPSDQKRKAEVESASLSKSRSATESEEPEHHKGLAHVTALRYWSTPEYTRIAIDLEDEVKYEAGRVPSPERVFFDLKDSRLAPGLNGKSYDVDDTLLKKIRIAQFKPNMARIVLELDSDAEYSSFVLPNPYRLIIDVQKRKTSLPVQTAAETQHAASPTERMDFPSPANDRNIHALAHGSESKVSFKTPALPPRAEVPLETSSLANVQIPLRALEQPKPSLAAERSRQKLAKADAADSDEDSSTKVGPPAIASRKGVRKANASTASASHEAAPTADGDLSLIRALGLKVGRIVVDAGHGGHDTGTIGPNGLMEKDLVLDVALRLGKLLEQKLGAEVVYTRHDDTFIPLEERTAIANQNQADLFISIHANSSPDPSARGVETYYLNFTRSADALEVAARENATSDTSIHDLQDLVKKIALKEKIEESREFAVTVDKALYTGEAVKNSGLKDRGVKKAPFVVLIGANMPSILAEISFVSNPSDERKLRTPEYRQRIAESLYRGVSRYAQGLSGVKVASARPNASAGQ